MKQKLFKSAISFQHHNSQETKQTQQTPKVQQPKTTLVSWQGIGNLSEM